MGACALVAAGCLWRRRVRCLDEWRCRLGRKLHPRRWRRVRGDTGDVGWDNRCGRVVVGIGGRVGCEIVLVVCEHC